jgi:hypothetical protein
MPKTSEWTSNPDGTETRPCAQGWCHHTVVKPATGRTPVYCSDACRQMDYRNRKQAAARRAEAIARHDAAERRITELAWTAINTYTGSNDLRRAAARRALVEHIVRTAMLHRAS